MTETVNNVSDAKGQGSNEKKRQPQDERENRTAKDTYADRDANQSGATSRKDVSSDQNRS